MERKETRRSPPADSPRIAAVPANNRSRLGNGSILPAGVDGRSSAARRWKEIFRDAMDRTTGRHETLCRQLASLVVARERLDAAMANGETVDVLGLVRLAGQVHRTMRALGLVTTDANAEPADAVAPDMTNEAIRALRGAHEAA
jgi:hypothetical protein